MKRLATTFFSALFLLTFTLPCCAQAVFETAWDLNQLWAPSNYPDYVCGVWSTNGNARDLTIAVLDTKEGNNGKQEILELIEDDSTVTFTYGKHSRNYLTDVQDELMELYKNNDEHGLYGTALDEKHGKISLLILKEYQGNQKTEALLNELTTQYGDIFVVSYCDEFVEEILTVTPEITAPVGQNNDGGQTLEYVTTIALVLILIFSVAFMVARKKKQAVIQTVAGETTTYSTLTEKEIEHRIKNADIPYPTKLDIKISDEINKL